VPSGGKSSNTGKESAAVASAATGSAIASRGRCWLVFVVAAGSTAAAAGLVDDEVVVAAKLAGEVMAAARDEIRRRNENPSPVDICSRPDVDPGLTDDSLPPHSFTIGIVP